MVNKYFRNVRTINELRQAADPEIKPFIRAKRQGHNLPNSWDDIPRSREKSWTFRQLRKASRNYRDSIRFM